MMCCVPLRTTLRAASCAKRYRLSNTQTITLGLLDQVDDLDGSPCKRCSTGQINADHFMPETRLDKVKKHNHLDERICLDCKSPFQPTSRTHVRCFPCGKVRRKALRKIADARRAGKSV